MASSIDDLLEQNLEYAYNENWGYLTSCPTNVGTGMRASVMVHLPALNITGNMNRILQTVAHIGLTIRGMYGEGTEIIGNIFQISNQITLGRAEEEIVESLTAVTRQIIDKEKEARKILFDNNRMQIEDKIWRSWGIMKNARMMSSQECMKLLSDIRLGVDMGIIENIPAQLLNEIMIETQTASLQKQHGKELSAGERDIIRAEMVRNKLGG
jgi:protein arginine kinase